jgi:hypothetical protein
MTWRYEPPALTDANHTDVTSTPGTRSERFALRSLCTPPGPRAGWGCNRGCAPRPRRVCVTLRVGTKSGGDSAGAALRAVGAGNAFGRAISSRHRSLTRARRARGTSKLRHRWSGWPLWDVSGCLAVLFDESVTAAVSSDRLAGPKFDDVAIVGRSAPHGWHSTDHTTTLRAQDHGAFGPDDQTGRASGS